MRHNQLDRELSLMLLMTGNHGYTVEQLCDKLGISRRNLYYYLDFFRDYGFIVEKKGTVYRLDKSSPFFMKLFKMLHFTEDEAITMRRLLDRVGDNNNIQVRHLKNKLDSLYDLNILDDVAIREHEANNVSVLYDAIKYKNKVVIHNYSSPHSDTRTHRIIEPFMFLDNNNEIRGYEISTGMNKTFKISRMESVEMLLDPWEHEDKHKRMFTDMFMFSGEERLPVSIRMGRLAYNLLTEEYPQSVKCITEDGAQHWILNTEVCSYVGISRFVLGLLENIEVLGSEDFREYLRKRIDSFKV